MFETRTEERPFEEGLHDMVPYPDRGKFAEGRAIYCRRCGAIRRVGVNGEEKPLAPCLGSPAAPAETAE